MRHEHSVQLRWSDLDSYGHVNHARALSLLEDARLALNAGAPRDPEGRPAGLILARLEIDYLHQLHYRAGEVVCVRSWITRLGTTSFMMRQELVQEDRVAIQLDAVLVRFDYATDRPHKLSDEERAYWSRFLEE